MEVENPVGFMNAVYNLPTRSDLLQEIGALFFCSQLRTMKLTPRILIIPWT
jgi:hypothetical protein